MDLDIHTSDVCEPSNRAGNPLCGCMLCCTLDLAAPRGSRGRRVLQRCITVWWAAWKICCGNGAAHRACRIRGPPLMCPRLRAAVSPLPPRACRRGHRARGPGGVTQRNAPPIRGNVASKQSKNAQEKAQTEITAGSGARGAVVGKARPQRVSHAARAASGVAV